jgi:hypothetical protein
LRGIALSPENSNTALDPTIYNYDKVASRLAHAIDTVVKVAGYYFGNRLAKRLVEEYQIFSEPPHRVTKASLYDRWTTELGIAQFDTTGNRVGRDVTRFMETLEKARKSALSPDFQNKISNGDIITNKQQRQNICPVYFVMLPVLAQAINTANTDKGTS